MTAITVYAPGHYDMADSYGLIACQLVRHLTRLGVRVTAMGMGKTVLPSQPADIRAITQQPVVASLGGIFLGYPTGYAKHANPLAHIGPRIAITMFESSRIPADWIAPLNVCEAVITPSHFCADVFKACGVTAPIHVVPLGVGEVYQYTPRRTPTLEQTYATGVYEHTPDVRPLTFLAFLDRGERKGGMVAYKAFNKAFGESMNYRLILKARTRKNSKDVTVAASEPNVEIVDRDMTEQELYELYCRCDVLINPHKGEGFGLIPREAASTGMVALTTAWSGTADDLDQWGWPLPYTLTRATWDGTKTLAGQDLGQWATVDADDVAKILRIVAEHTDVFRNTTRYVAANVQRLYSWQTFAERVLHIWKEAAIGHGLRAAAIPA